MGRDRNLLDRQRVMVVSQLPPPVHGSTLMTRVFLETLDDSGFEWVLTDRRFSTEIGDVGRFTLRKAVSAVGLLARVFRAGMDHTNGTCVYFVTTSRFSMLVDWFAIELLRLTGTRIVLYPHTTGFRSAHDSGGLRRLAAGRIVASAAAVVAISDVTRVDIEPYCEVPIVVIPNRLPEEPPALDPKLRRDTVLFLSNLIPGKGHEDFLDVAERIAPGTPDVRFVIAGAADASTAAQVRDRIERSGLADRIVYVGSVGGNEKWSLLNRAIALVFPSSLFEASPLTVVEALASATPVIGYRRAAVPELVEDGRTGVLVDVRDLDALEEAVRALVADPDTADSIGSAGRDDYLTRFRPKHFSAAWADVLFTPTGRRKREMR